MRGYLINSFVQSGTYLQDFGFKIWYAKIFEARGPYNFECSYECFGSDEIVVNESFGVWIPKLLAFLNTQ